MPVKTKKRKVTRTSMKRRADRLFSLKVRERGVCQAALKDSVRCGGMLQCAHIEGRKNHRLRWEELNALSLCAGHHRFYTSRPLLWAWFIRNWFPESWEYVMAHQNEMWDKDYDAIFERLK